MNFDIDYRHTHIVRSPQAVPLLVLIGEWGKLKGDPFSRVDVILLILRGIQPLANFDHGLEVSEMLDLLNDSELKNSFKKSLDNALSDLTSFMDLFNVLTSLFVPPDKSRPALLDNDCFNSIIGIYVRQCVLEYKKLTFSQLMRFHMSLLNYFQQESDGTYKEMQSDANKFCRVSRQTKDLDFASQLRELVFWEKDTDLKNPLIDNPKVFPPRMELGSEALKLAELHGKFGHHIEGLQALEEAIRLAQQNDNFLILQHALAWLLKMGSFDSRDNLIMLRKFVKNSEVLKSPLLGLWGRLQEVVTQISMSDSPKKMLQNLMTSEVDYLSSYDQESHKSALHISMLTILAESWKHLGHELLAQHYAQLVCHMTACDFPYKMQSLDGVDYAIGIITQHLMETGNIDRSLMLLRASISKFKDAGLPSKVMSKLEEEIKLKLVSEMDSTKRHLMNVQTFSGNEGLYRSVLVAKREGQLSKAVDIILSAIK